ncbi:MAG: ACP S-malonyltransferase [Deltaproteobacteria bacterium]
MARAPGTQTTQMDDAHASPGRERSHADLSSLAIWVFPGLGCRYVGMGYDIIGRFPAADRLIGEASAKLGYDLIAVCLEGSGRKHVPARQEAQVIYVIECAYAAVLRGLGFHPRAVSGHSLGSLAAGCVCGGYDFFTGLDLVTQIEALQEELVDGCGQAMGVIIGLPEREVESLLAAGSGVFLANWNSPGQYVIGGDASSVDMVLAGALGRGAKQARRLAGERALHTPAQRAVASRLREHLDSVGISRPEVPFISCHDASVIQTAAGLRTFLADFLAVPVRWETTVRTLGQSWGSDFVEVGPGNVLSNMLPFIDRTSAIRTASDLLDQKT